MVVVPGYDLWVWGGQSNGEGRGTVDPNIDLWDPRVMYWPGSGATTPPNNFGQITRAVEPLTHKQAAQGVGSATAFARWYLQMVDQSRRALIVAACRGSTTFGPALPLMPPLPRWGVDLSGEMFEYAITQTQNALAAAGEGSRVVGMVWQHGETDGDQSYPAAEYQRQLDLLIDAVRTRLDVPSMPFLIVGMVPERLQGQDGTRVGIDAVQRDTVRRKSWTAYVPGPANSHVGDRNHYNAVGARRNARELVGAWQRALVN